MRFGTERTQNTLDKEGSTVTAERNIVDFKVVTPVRHRYEMRVKVRNSKDELTEYLKFSDSLDGGKTKLDPGFRIEYTRQGNADGYYFVVKCWTVLEQV
jgi:hypothetical protein